MTNLRLAGQGFLAGLLLTASLPPFGWWPLGLAGAAVLAGSLAERRARERLLCGAAAGLALYGVGWWWMGEFSAPGYVLAILAESAILAVAMLVVRPGRLWALPAALVLAEAVRDRWPFGGVPLAGLPLGQVGGPLAPAARVGGQLLIVALVGLVAVAVVTLARRRWVSGGLGLAAVAVVVTIGVLVPGAHDAGPLRVAAVQGGGQRGVRALFRDPQGVFLAQLRTTDAVVAPVDLVVWPEDVIDVDRVEGSGEAEAVAAIARRLDTTVVAGIVEDAGPDHFHNAAVAWSSSGRIVARYDKVHPVPFGEVIPGRGLVEHFADLAAVPRDMARGYGPGLLRTPAGRLGVAVSYEVFFADRGRDAVRHGATILLVPTNASSFSTGQVPAQELGAARLRALETGRTVVQAAPTGYTAIVDWRGRVLAHTALGPRAVLQRAVRVRAGQTLATRLGEAPLVGLAALGAAVLVLSRRRGRGTSQANRT